jgi:predicted nucleotidyltransferase
MFDNSHMRLHAYLEQVIGSRTAIALIRALLTHRGKVFTVRGLAETAGVSASEASLVVRQLEEAGVLRLQPVGRSFLVTLNERSFVLQRIMKPVIRAESETLSELVKLLRGCFLHKKDAEIESVYLFGSVVRGEERKDSDVDLLVISSDFGKASAVVSTAQEKVAAVFNKQLSPLIWSKGELVRKKSGNIELVDSIASNHILVAGTDLLRED